jgi:2-phosphosulfolactate phosphatase
MNINVYFTPFGLTSADIAGKPVIVVDILRATTTIIAALANGARAVIPAAASDEAARIAQNLERGQVLLAGERRGDPISGFDLGNSPCEMTADAVAGKTLVMSTTNGTPAIQAAEAGAPVLIGAATNFSAVVARAQALVEEDGEISILCAGRERGFALEDAYAAGRFAHALIPPGERRRIELNDAAVAALELIKRYGDRWKRAVSASAAARDLGTKGYKGDVVAATEVDRYDLVPVYVERQVILTGDEKRRQAAVGTDGR